MELAALLGICLLLGLFPTGIPASVVVVGFALRPGVAGWEAVLVATAGLTIGRALLYAATAFGAPHVLHGGTRANVDYLGTYLHGRRRVGLALFLAPLLPGTPSGGIFAAAGALRLPVLPLLAGYAVGRIAWLAPLVATASASQDQVEALLRHGLTPRAILPGLLALGISTFVLLRLDWAATIRARRPRLLHGGAPRAQPEADPPG